MRPTQLEPAHHGRAQILQDKAFVAIVGPGVAQHAKGIAAPGEGPDIFNIVEDYNMPRRLEKLAFDLSAKGWPDARIEKLLGANFARLYREVW